ncbi:17953_t:CDS:2 [Cetraspora pellucida]|uniref:17953_t:CDS:1 n=1 Tax=Cetraspora pellucida TaxID=1433469 RepID=A0A9N9IWD2_9GLOM|nr:17953_t:CDS:2 [Cetraspora pellucida]
MKHKVILDQTIRNRNIQHHLNELERDNYAEVPELEIVSGTITKPRRTSEIDTSQNRKTKARSKKQLLSQLTVKKTLNALLEESVITISMIVVFNLMYGGNFVPYKVTEEI